MSKNHEEPTETSPLLGKLSHVPPEPEDAPDGSFLQGSSSHGQTDVPSKNGGDEESLDHVTEYQGMPEVKAKLKYILPALAIGIFLSAADQTLIVTMYGKIGSDLEALNKTSWVSTA